MRIEATDHHDAAGRRSEPAIALINIVFLMLIFFLVAAQVAPPLDGDVALVSTRDLDSREPPDALVIAADGQLSYRGATLTPAQYVALKRVGAPALAELRLVPDRYLSATRLIEIGDELRALGVERVFIVTERSLAGQ
ncbi:ExbD/TolR family protein [Oceaniradius stylonematis]|uniref:ExbD/TolR family protein n=1 Tax=Oceaniradius stylonematis TaxID=2184161 RepID=UPI0035CEB68D